MSDTPSTQSATQSAPSTKRTRRTRRAPRHDELTLEEVVRTSAAKGCKGALTRAKLATVRCLDIFEALAKMTKAKVRDLRRNAATEFLTAWRGEVTKAEISTHFPGKGLLWFKLQEPGWWVESITPDQLLILARVIATSTQSRLRILNRSTGALIEADPVIAEVVAVGTAGAEVVAVGTVGAEVVAVGTAGAEVAEVVAMEVKTHVLVQEADGSFSATRPWNKVSEVSTQPFTPMDLSPLALRAAVGPQASLYRNFDPEEVQAAFRISPGVHYFDEVAVKILPVTLEEAKEGLESSTEGPLRALEAGQGIRGVVSLLAIRLAGLELFVVMQGPNRTHTTLNEYMRLYAGEPKRLLKLLYKLCTTLIELLRVGLTVRNLSAGTVLIYDEEPKVYNLSLGVEEARNNLEALFSLIPGGIPKGIFEGIPEGIFEGAIGSVKEQVEEQYENIRSAIKEKLSQEVRREEHFLCGTTLEFLSTLPAGPCKWEAPGLVAEVVNSWLALAPINPKILWRVMDPRRTSALHAKMMAELRERLMLDLETADDEQAPHLLHALALLPWSLDLQKKVVDPDRKKKVVNPDGTLDSTSSGPLRRKDLLAVISMFLSKESMPIQVEMMRLLATLTQRFAHHIPDLAVQSLSIAMTTLRSVLRESRTSLMEYGALARQAMRVVRNVVRHTMKLETETELTTLLVQAFTTLRPLNLHGDAIDALGSLVRHRVEVPEEVVDGLFDLVSSRVVQREARGPMPTHIYRAVELASLIETPERKERWFRIVTQYSCAALSQRTGGLAVVAERKERWRRVIEQFNFGAAPSEAAGAADGETTVRT